jgi:biopolymer transport protein ExbD
MHLKARGAFSMAKQRPNVDVWLVEPNTVYKDVPFTVVADWIQQGRLLEEDKVRASGGTEWRTVGSVPAFAPYLPRPEPFRAEDEAEALAPIGLDFGYKKPHGESDDEVDMIPLIDVSLVLLIFFMMVTPGIGAASFILKPGTVHGETYDDPKIVWIGIDYEGPAPERRAPVFYVGEGKKGADPQNSKLATLDELIERLTVVIGDRSKVEITVNAHKDVPEGVVRKLLVKIQEKPDLRKKVLQMYTGVGEKK